MTVSEPRAVLWDLDGTLVDTAAHHLAAWTATLGPRGVDLTPEMFQRTFGRRNDAVLRDLLGDQLTDGDIQEIGGAKEADYRARLRETPLAPLAGVAEWLVRLHDAGWRQAIASSAPHANIRVILDALGLGETFAAIVGDEDVARGKPDPQVFLVAAAKLGVPPRRCIVVEDSPAGVEAAHRAGMRVIGVRADQLALDADLTVASLADLPPDAFARLLSAPCAQRSGR